ncbi:hypothetical protein [Deinococcus roseus]|uniref:Uncharacterized protein n=1 Tax=Deinococcus roseus TaxID=392414 RepID=A0ABQ2CYU8_9DEIO|nr:hypothetical protein [Deinococcus roseus]GGJ27898.1 hypothetical protein GCM10008938_12460 [Deinococcus roseus]
MVLKDFVLSPEKALSVNQNQNFNQCRPGFLQMNRVQKDAFLLTTGFPEVSEALSEETTKQLAASKNGKTIEQIQGEQSGL